ncbi:MAG TPA: flagellar basal body rod C-terminal domain-containing protein, partial [Novosphingobium sp.]|nr:flagellar basal body rod C-terminal domain-containing protein [Novosphingobium sp.]
NQLATSLAALNTQIAADNDPANNNAGLLDSRDQILTKLSSYGDLKITYNTNNTVQVQMGGTSGPVLVNGNTASNLAMTTASNGTVSYTVGGSALTLSGGSLAGDQQALITGAGGQSQLDTIASTLISTVNTAQTNGTDLTGTAGVAMFSGTSAGTMTIALTSGSQIAAAKSGSAANSQDATNLTSMQSAISSAGTSNSTNQLIFSLSSAVSGATTTQTALDTISSNAKTSLASQAGVSLDTEATNLIQYQQAYQASGKVIQVAQTLFDQLLNI